MDTGVFDQGRYWAVDVAYAKASATEVLAKITIKNHASEAATLSVLPTSGTPAGLLRRCQHCPRSD